MKYLLPCCILYLLKVFRPAAYGRRKDASMQPSLHKLIASVGAQHDVARIVLFGSRAPGDNGARSDVDPAVFDLPESEEAAFLDGIDELPTMLKFDVMLVRPYTSPVLLDEIKRNRVILYEAPIEAR